MEKLSSKTTDTLSGRRGTSAESYSPLQDTLDPALLSKERCAGHYSPEPPAALIYQVQGRCCNAVKQLRSMLAEAGLSVVSEVDATAVMRRSLRIGSAPSHILLVTCPRLLLQAFVTGASVVTLLPVHIVAIERNHWTRIYFMNPARIDPAVGGAFSLNLHQLYSRIIQCLDRLGPRVPGEF